MFITFEGLDGSGKTTQARLLGAWLRDHGLDVVLTREPGGTTIGQSLRNLLLGEREQAICPMTEMLLMAADRAQHVQEVIRPALVNNKIVVCDRYVDSSLAYQGYGLECDPASVQAVNEIATGKLIPDLTFLLDVDIASLVRRLERRRRQDRIEGRGVLFLERVRNGYLRIAEENSDRVYQINTGARTIEDIQSEIQGVVRLRFGERLKL